MVGDTTWSKGFRLSANSDDDVVISLNESSYILDSLQKLRLDVLFKHKSRLQFCLWKISWPDITPNAEGEKKRVT